MSSGRNPALHLQNVPSLSAIVASTVANTLKCECLILNPFFENCSINSRVSNYIFFRFYDPRQQDAVREWKTTMAVPGADFWRTNADFFYFFLFFFLFFYLYFYSYFVFLFLILYFHSYFISILFIFCLYFTSIYFYFILFYFILLYFIYFILFYFYCLVSFSFVLFLGFFYFFTSLSVVVECLLIYLWA